MYKVHPFITADGSVGLYNTEINDIYHSATGAVEEAYEKFILPVDINNFIGLNTDIKLLDICYGIGYNSKIFLNLYLKNFYKNKNMKNDKQILSEYNGKIYDDNQNSQNYDYPIYSDKNFDKNTNNMSAHEINQCKIKNEIYNLNDNVKISITAIDNDKTLGFLSPFISSKNFKNFLKSDFKNDKIEKYRKILSPDKLSSISKCSDITYSSDNNNFYTPAINAYILYYLINKYPEMLVDNDINNILSDKEYVQYFDADIYRLFKLYRNYRCQNTPISHLNLFLHNIYYKYISSRYKNDFKALKYLNIDFNIIFNDARKVLPDILDKYNIIFLDAFTPSVMPTLWSYDFIKVLYQHIEENGILVTYTSSAPVRNALLKSGFYIGKVYNQYENKYTGTIASKNKNLIKNPLSDYEIKLLNTKSGIVYRDPNLSANSSTIIDMRNEDCLNSSLMTVSELKKQQ